MFETKVSILSSMLKSFSISSFAFPFNSEMYWDTRSSKRLIERALNFFLSFFFFWFEIKPWAAAYAMTYIIFLFFGMVGYYFWARVIEIRFFGGVWGHNFYGSFCQWRIEIRFFLAFSSLIAMDDWRSVIKPVNISLGLNHACWHTVLLLHVLISFLCKILSIQNSGSGSFNKWRSSFCSWRKNLDKDLFPWFLSLFFCKVRLSHLASLLRLTLGPSK